MTLWVILVKEPVCRGGRERGVARSASSIVEQSEKPSSDKATDGWTARQQNRRATCRDIASPGTPGRLFNVIVAYGSQHVEICPGVGAAFGVVDLAVPSLPSLYIFTVALVMIHPATAL